MSYNKADADLARAVASALSLFGAEVWFDEWQIAPGQSIVGGIESGLASADVFIVLWSESAAASNWVGTEWRAYITRRVQDDSLRVIPLRLDEAPLPVLLSDFRGMVLRSTASVAAIAAQVMGTKPTLMDEALGQVLSFIEEMGQNANPLSRFDIGPLDSFLGELPAGRICVVGGPRSVGRTSLIISMLLNAATHSDDPLLFVSLDSSERMATFRILSNRSRVDLGNLMSGAIRVEEWPRIGGATSWLASTAIEISAPAVASLALVEEAIRATSSAIRAGSSYPLLVFVDDLHVLVDTPDVGAEIKRIAISNRCAVIGTCRNSDDAAGEALWGSLEATADCALELTENGGSEIEVTVSKNRYGRTGSFVCVINEAKSRISMVEEEIDGLKVLPAFRYEEVKDDNDSL